MRFHAIAGSAIAAAAVQVAALTPAAAHAATVCTWGGTPLAPTGQSHNNPGVSNTPSHTALRFHATGALAGGPGCQGKLRFVGQIDRGSTCALIHFHGRAYGLPGVRTFDGTSAAGMAPARLIDAKGRVVGSETAQFLTNAPFSDCMTERGLRSNNFSSVVTLLGSPVSRRHANSFDGSCRLSGDIRFKQPLGNLPRPTGFTDVGHGTCTGQLNGSAVSNIPVANRVGGIGTLSCAGGRTTTADTLIFGKRTRIRVFTDAAGGGTQLVGHFRGAVSGDGVVHVDLLPYVDQSVLAACQAGALRHVRYDLTARTVTPMVG